MENILTALEDLGDIVVAILTNRIFYTTFLTWLIAQTIKVLFHVAKKRRFDFRLFVGTGGMPSAHTAAVTAATVSVGMEAGFGSPVFMVCLLYCIVVITDAVGVRQAAGKQAEILNKMMDEAEHNEFSSERLKELLGHTPKEAFAGLLLGLIIPVLFF